MTSRLPVGLLVAAAGAVVAGCGFVAGVDFFGLERAAPEIAESGTNDAGGSDDASAVESGPPPTPSACQADAGCEDFDDCAPLDADSSLVTRGAGVVHEVTRARAVSTPCSFHAVLPATTDATRRTSAYRAVRSARDQVLVDLDFWMDLERVDTSGSGTSGEARTAVAAFLITIAGPDGGPGGTVITKFLVGPTKVELVQVLSNGTTPLSSADTSTIVGSGWRKVHFSIARTTSGSNLRFDASVRIDNVPLLAGTATLPQLSQTLTLEGIVGLVDATAKTSAPEIYVDDVTLTTTAPN